MDSRQHSPGRPTTPAAAPRRRGGFTLLEALVASVILGASVIAVVSAMSTAQKLAFEGQKRVLGAMAANDLLIELATLDYSVLKSHQPINNAVGQMESLDGTAYPVSFWALGRTMTVEQTKITDAKSGAVVQGVKVVVSAIDEDKTLCAIEAFFAEPQGGG
jgi:type II secretory pathway pseudopilin PulG